MEASKDLEKELGEEYICKSAWDIKDIIFKIYRKHNMKDSPTLGDLEQLGYAHKRITINGKSYLKIFKLEKC